MVIHGVENNRFGSKEILSPNPADVIAGYEVGAVM
jgi:hypothetical protein